MLDLKIKHAKNKTGKIFSVKDAKKGQTYTCLECNEELILRAGKIKTKHFSHKNTSNCSNESIYHKVAKEYIFQAAKEKKIKFNKNCQSCRYKKVNVNLNYTHAVIESSLDKFKIDVALFDNQKISCAVEVFFTHLSTEEKIAYFNDNSVYYVEESVFDIIHDWEHDEELNLKIKNIDQNEDCNTCVENKAQEILEQKRMKKIEKALMHYKFPIKYPFISFIYHNIKFQFFSQNTPEKKIKDIIDHYLVEGVICNKEFELELKAFQMRLEKKICELVNFKNKIPQEYFKEWDCIEYNEYGVDHYTNIKYKDYNFIVSIKETGKFYVKYENARKGSVKNNWHQVLNYMNWITKNFTNQRDDSFYYKRYY